MRRSLLNKRILPKPLRQALVLITLLLLPSAAWGQTTVIKTITFDKNKGDVTINNAENFPNAIPVSVNEKVGSNTNDPIYKYDSNVMIINSGALLNTYSYSNDKAVFTLDEDANTEFPNWFVIRIPGNYPEKPTEVTLYFSYTTSISNEDGDGYCAKIQFGNEENYTDTGDSGDSKNYLTTGLNGLKFSANGTDGIEITGREGTNSLDIYIFLDGEDGVSPTFTIEKIEMEYSTDFYNLSVAGIPVTGVNKDDVLSNGTVKSDGTLSGDGTVSFTEGALTLDNAILSDGIEYKGSDDLTIALNGDSKLSYIKYVEGTASGTPQLLFTKATEATDCSLEINSESVISGFSNVDFGPFGTISSGPIGYGQPDPQESFICLLNPVTKVPITNVVITTATTYPLWIAGKQATAGDLTGDEFQSGDNTFNTITNVSFTPGSTNILSFNNGGITTRGEVAKLPAIISNLDNLTIQFTGENSISLDDLTQNPSPIKSLNSEASITFTSSAEGASLSCTMGSAAFTDGFKTVNYENGLGCLMTSGYKKIQKMTLNSPTISTSEYEGDIKINFNNEFGSYYDGIHYFYKIDYADSSIEDPEEVELPVNSAYYIEPETPLLLSSLTSPCTIMAYAKFNTTTSTANKAKLFAIADKTIVFNDKTKGTELTVNDLEIIPATEGEGVSFKIRGVDNPDVIIPSSTEGNGYKYSIAGIGRCEVSVEIIAENPTIQVLNPVQVEVRYAEGVVTVVPDKPTITITKKDPERNYYLNTDEITITRTPVDGDNLPIFYSWSNVEIKPSQQYTENDPFITYNGPIPAQTGTLRAWVGYNEGDNYYYNSEVVSKEFTVKTDISDYTVQGLATSATYTGAAIVPEFTVVDKKETTLASTNYTVSYQSVEVVAGDEGSGPSINYTDVPEMVEVGSYRIVITGTGDSYGGTTYANFAITKANLSIVTIENIEDQTYTGSTITLEGVTVTLNGKTISPDEYEITGYTNNTNVTTETQKATVTITATATSEHFTANTTKTAEFNIIPKELTEEMVTVSTNPDPLIYNGEDQTPNVTVTIKDGETTLKEGEDKDYTISYKIDDQIAEETVDAGTYTIVITGQGNYTGEVNTKTFTIAAMDASNATITLEADKTYTYNGSDQTPAVVSVELDGGTIPDTNYDISYSNNKNAGLATAGENAPTVIVTFKNNYSGEATTTFTIEQADLSGYVVTGLTTPTAYTGSPITPTFSVKATTDAETSLTANTDYSVKYQQAGADVDEMKDAGDYKILITGEGNYKRSLDADFTIERAQLNLTINLKDWAYGDTPNEPSLEGNLGEGDITWEYKAAGAEAYSAWSTLTTTTDAGTYMVKATVAETDNYKGGSKEAEFVIKQLDISQADITLDNNELTYNGEQQTVNVTKVMAGNIEVPIDCYEVSDNTGTEAGDYTLIVKAKTEDGSGNVFKNNFTGSAEKDWKIKNRTVTTDELGLSENQSQATYYSETEALEVPEGVVAYIITGVNGNNVVTQRIRYIPKRVAVFVEQTTSTENPLEVIPDASELPLKGTAVDLNVASISGGTVYVLYKGEFVKSTTGTIPAKRCYLLLPNNVAAGTRAFGIIGGGSDGSTAIKSINDEPSTIDNWYDMGGHRIEKPTKTGIYIKNGKKVAIK